jgi:hypothetical protein
MRHRPRRARTRPVRWAVPIKHPRTARVAVDCFRDRGLSRVQPVVGPTGRVYVRWADGGRLGTGFALSVGPAHDPRETQ